MSEMEAKNPGEPLRSSREKLGLSINDVSVATKINPRILKALEEGNKTGLPPNSFTRGFIRSYAAYLKIDSKPILQAFDLNEVVMIPTTSTPNSNSDELGNHSSSQERSAKSYSNMRPVGESSWTSKALVVSGMLVLVLLIFGIKKVVDRYAQERVIDPKVTAAPVDGTVAPVDGATNPVDPAAEAADEEGGDGDDATVAAVASATAKPPEGVAAVAAVTAVTPEQKVEAEKKAALEAKTAADKFAADKKAADEKAAAEAKALAEKKAAEVKAAADAKAAADKLAADKKAAEDKAVAEAKALADKKTADAKLAADKKAADEKLAAEKKAAADKKAEEKKLAADKKAADAKEAKEKAAADAKAPAAVDAKADSKPKAAKVGPQEVIIEALDTVQLTIQVDGEAPKKITLAPESLHTVKAKSEIFLEISDGGMVNIVYNGHDRGVPGDLGKPAKLKYP